MVANSGWSTAPAMCSARLLKPRARSSGMATSLRCACRRDLMREESGERITAARQAGLDGADRRTGAAGYLIDRQVGEVVQGECLALGERQLAQGREQRHAGVDPAV